jgi:hypothetical protein
LDDNTRDILTTGLTVLGGFLTGVVVAAIGFRQARILEGDRQRAENARLEDSARREDERLREAADERSRERWMGEKRSLYARYLQSTDEWRKAGSVPRETPEQGEAVAQLMSIVDVLDDEIKLMAPKPVREASFALFQAISAETRNAQRKYRDEPTEDSYDPKNWTAAYAAFLVAARNDLTGE